MFAQAVHATPASPTAWSTCVTGRGPDAGRGPGRPPRRRAWCPSPAPPPSAGGSWQLAAGRPSSGVHLELGGKAPFVVFDDADLEAAVHGAVAGVADQHRAGLHGRDPRATCSARSTTPSSHGVADVMARCALGRPARPGDRPGPAGQRAAARPGRRLRRAGRAATAPRSSAAARSPGGDLAARRLLRADPRRRSRAGLARSSSDEVFGPVLVVLPFDTDDEAHRAGQRHAVRPRRLGLDHATSTGRCAATREIRPGCVWVNDHIPIISEMPHGGYKASGFGKDMSRVLLRGVHAGQARHVRQHRRWPARLAPHDLQRPLITVPDDRQSGHSSRPHRCIAACPTRPQHARCRRAGSRRQSLSRVRQSRGSAGAVSGGRGALAVVRHQAPHGVRRPRRAAGRRRTCPTPRRSSTGPTGPSTSTSTTRRKKHPTLDAFTGEDRHQGQLHRGHQRQRRVLRQDQAAAARRPGHRPRPVRASPTGWPPG